MWERKHKTKTPFQNKIILIIFGIFLFVFLLEIGLRLGGFILLSLQEYTNKVSIRQKGTYRIMCLGESTTVFGGNGGRHSYPNQLEEILNAANIDIRFNIINKGISGTNTTNILHQLEDNLNRYKPDMVITMMGINDELQYLPYTDINAPLTTRLVNSLRIYKLATFFKLHLLAKVKGHVNLQPNIEVVRDQTELQNSNIREESLKKVITLNPQDEQAHLELSQYYIDRGDYTLAETSLKKAIDLNPHNHATFIELGKCYMKQADFTQSEESFKKAIELNPQDEPAYLELGRCYINQGNFSQAEASYKKALELNPRNTDGYKELNWLYIKERKFAQAKEVLTNVSKLDTKDDRVYAAMAVLLEEMQEYESAQRYYEKVNELRFKYYNPKTVHNYQKLKEILDKRKIKLVCVQYPMRSLEPLKRIFENQEGCIFVDNEEVFKEKIRQSSYQKYFVDMMGGDFGHCTDLGNRLLAENIAQAISREWFKK